MVSPEDFKGDSSIARLKSLVGGEITRSAISGSIDNQAYYPEEGPIYGPTDDLDVLGAYVGMDATSFGLLTRKVSISEVHARDSFVNELDRESKKRMRQEKLSS